MHCKRYLKHLFHKLILSVVFCSLALSESAVSEEMTALPSPEYQSEIKGLTISQIDALLTGKAMGLDNSVKLNRYPEPSKVLQHAEELELSVAQINRSKMLEKIAQRDAIRLGREIVTNEKALDKLLNQETVDRQDLSALINEISDLKGQLRLIYLKHFLDQKELLNADQIAGYYQLNSAASMLTVQD